MRRPRKNANGPRASDVRGCSVYEIDGRILFRTVDRSDGLGIERDEATMIDGFPDVPAATVGRMVMEALDRTVEIPRPESWRKSSEYAKPLLTASPKRYTSYRSWQRAARLVGVSARPDRIALFRWHPDLNGSWLPAAQAGRPAREWLQEADLPTTASADDLGAAILTLLQQPSLRDG